MCARQHQYSLICLSLNGTDITASLGGLNVQADGDEEAALRIKLNLKLSKWMLEEPSGSRNGHLLKEAFFLSKQVRHA